MITNYEFFSDLFLFGRLPQGLQEELPIPPKFPANIASVADEDAERLVHAHDAG